MSCHYNTHFVATFRSYINALPLIQREDVGTAKLTRTGALGSEAAVRLLIARLNNKCIGDDTKAAARESLNCIKNKKK